MTSIPLNFLISPGYHHHRCHINQMRNIPQELVDKIIDHLGEFTERPAWWTSRHKTSQYSTVSRRWVNRTQHHHFKFLCFVHGGDLRRWKTTIEPGPSGVSRHVRTLYWRYVSTFEGFQGHLRALTNIKQATFSRCGVFCSLDDASPLIQVASNLVELAINNTNATPAVLSSFLAALPQLRRFCAINLLIELDGAPTVPLDNAPFFKGINNLTLLLEDHAPGKLDWLPSTARFANLGIGTSCIHHDLDLVNSWIASSRETLERLDIHWEIEFDGVYLGTSALVSSYLPLPAR